MDVNLVMFRGESDRRTFKLPRETTLVGRREDCDLRIPLSEISRKHCRFIKEADTIRVEDLGSSNGTFHNGERIQESIVGAGDTVQVGPVVFVVQIDGQPADDQLHPVAAVGEEPVEQSTESGGLSPTAQSEVESGTEFDPLEALTSEDSEYDFVVHDDPTEGEDSVHVDLDETQPGRDK